MALREKLSPTGMRSYLQPQGEVHIKLELETLPGMPIPKKQSPQGLCMASHNSPAKAFCLLIDIRRHIPFPVSAPTPQAKPTGKPQDLA